MDGLDAVDVVDAAGAAPGSGSWIGKWELADKRKQDEGWGVPMFWPMWYTQRDERVCPVCREMHGRIYPPGLYPPKPHPRCRCNELLVPVWIVGGEPAFEDPETGMPGWPDDVPAPVYDEGWLDSIGEEARRAWVLLVAWLIRSERPVPEILAPLVDEAEDYNREHEDEEEGERDEEENRPWWLLLVPFAEDEQSGEENVPAVSDELQDLLQEWMEEINMSAITEPAGEEPVEAPPLIPPVGGKSDAIPLTGGKSDATPITGGGNDVILPTEGENEAPIRAMLGQVRLQAGAGAGAGDRREYAVRFIRAGRIRMAGNREGWWEVTEEALRDAAERRLLDNRPAFIDHADAWEGSSLRDMAGQALESVWNPQDKSIDGTIRLYPTQAGAMIQDLIDTILADMENGIDPPDVGLSLVFWPEKWERFEEVDSPDRLMKIRYVESADFVFEPAADGRIKQILSSYFQRGAKDMAGLNDNPTKPAGSAPPEAPASNAAVSLTPAAQYADEWAQAMRGAAVPALLAASGLPQVSRDRLALGSYQSPQDLETAIQAERDYLARLQEDQVVQMGNKPPRGQGIVLGRTGVEQVAVALDALLAGTRPADAVQPLSGIREAYHLLSGDYEMTGLFHPDRVYLANVNSSTMAGLVANALNKRMVNMFQQYPRWWEPIVFMEDFASLQDVRWITLGGIGELPTVSEGAAYSELTWDDQTETDAFVKKGGYLGITLESIDKDDTGRLRAAPRALAQAAWLTLSKAVSGIFTDNAGVGPAMSDGYYLFDASHHSNLLTTALSWTAYVAVRTAMRKQTELHSGERLGSLTAPKFLVVPPDLEITALQVLASAGEPGTADNDVNPEAEGDTREAMLQAARKRVIVVDLWTDTDNWAAVADPLLYPSIGLGFRYGRIPEIFSVADPTGGLMFSNDTMPVKIRFFFAVGPTDWRGLHKSNV